jgi:hypothetical protein
VRISQLQRCYLQALLCAYSTPPLVLPVVLFLAQPRLQCALAMNRTLSYGMGGCKRESNEMEKPLHCAHATGMVCVAGGER